jgi:hypothetical protein
VVELLACELQRKTDRRGGRENVREWLMWCSLYWWVDCDRDVIEEVFLDQFRKLGWETEKR